MTTCARRLKLRGGWHRARVRGQAARGFTLIELLVAVAIIALLIAILLPSLHRARQQARVVACQANLSNLAKGWHAYLNDSKGFFLKGVDAEYVYGGKQGNGQKAYGADPDTPVCKPLNRYCGLPPVTYDAQVFCCPRDAGDPLGKGRCYDFFGTSYRMNHFLVGQDRYIPQTGDPCRDVMTELGKRLAGMTWAQITNPSQLLLVGDAEWERAWYYRTKASWYRDWHGRGRFNSIAFLDGGVRFVRIRKGIHVDPHYAIIPFRDLQAPTAAKQQEVFP